MTKRRWTKDEINEYRKEHGAFYFNRDDSNLFVPKAYGIGGTLNLANPISWVILLGIIALISRLS
jgi:uncharacterized membrane protein